jgi:C4-dicarboxylate transporter
MAQNIVPFTDKDEKLLERLVAEREKAHEKFPLWYALFATFGFVCTLYGFEKLIDKVHLFTAHPWILFATGLAMLIATGTAYQKFED